MLTQIFQDNSFIAIGHNEVEVDGTSVTNSIYDKHNADGDFSPIQTCKYTKKNKWSSYTYYITKSFLLIVHINSFCCYLKRIIKYGCILQKSNT